MPNTPKKIPLWEADNEFIVLRSKGSTEIATINTRLKKWREHARLIVAAPEMLEALKLVHDKIDFNEKLDGEIDDSGMAKAVRRALTLATGDIYDRP